MTLFGVTQNRKVVTFTRSRTNRGKGEKTSTNDVFIGTIQPMTGKDLELVTVGREDRGKVKIYSDRELNVGIEGTNKSGDLVFYQSKKYEIIQAMDFQNGVLPHYKYIAEFRGKI
jgi:hypothetical protein